MSWLFHFKFQIKKNLTAIKCATLKKKVLSIKFWFKVVSTWAPSSAEENVWQIHWDKVKDVGLYFVVTEFGKINWFFHTSFVSLARWSGNYLCPQCHFVSLYQMEKTGKTVKFIDRSSVLNVWCVYLKKTKFFVSWHPKWFQIDTDRSMSLIVALSARTHGAFGSVN